MVVTTHTDFIFDEHRVHSGLEPPRSCQVPTTLDGEPNPVRAALAIAASLVEDSRAMQTVALPTPTPPSPSPATTSSPQPLGVPELRARIAMLEQRRAAAQHRGNRTNARTISTAITQTRKRLKAISASPP